MKHVRKFFKKSGIILTVVPSYIGGFMSLVWSSNKLDMKTEKSIKRNNYWQSRMSVSIRAGRDLMEIPDQLASIHDLTLERMNDCIHKQTLNTNNTYMDKHINA